MKDKIRETEPASRTETIRKQIIELLGSGTYSAKELSADVHIPEKEVYGHLEHIQKTLMRERRKLAVIGPECIKCGFVFTRMDRPRNPGKCPRCRSEHIREPEFYLSEDRTSDERDRNRS